KALRSGFLECGLVARAWLGDVGLLFALRWCRGAVCCRACGYGGALGVRLLDQGFHILLRAASVVVQLPRPVVLVQRALALPQYVENFPQVDVAPDLRPLFRGFWYGLQRLAECVCGSLVVLLVEKRLAHPEIRQRT